MERTETDTLIERMVTMRKTELRKASAKEGLQLVHAEILDYLANCNRYSNTTLAVADYLGHTKGTVSQSLALLEKKGFVSREADKNDRRIFRLFLTAQGSETAKRLFQAIPVVKDDSPFLVAALRQLLGLWQTEHHHHGFGLCRTCRHNIDLGNNQFKCGLTGESLKKQDTEKICREHDYPEKIPA